jgi:hypothetical protein
MESVDGKAWCMLIYNAFRKEKLSDQLPMFNIFSSLFASMRWNKDRKYKDGNDTIDAMHASASLPYCDYFFTEKELNTVILQLSLDTTFSCITERDPNKVLERLNAI